MFSICTYNAYKKLSSLLNTCSYYYYLLPYNRLHFSFIKKYLWSIYYVPGTFEVAGDMRKNKSFPACVELLF